MNGPDRTATHASCRHPARGALADAGSGRVSMPFLPTLVTVAVLAAASVICPTAQRPSPVPVSAPPPAAAALTIPPVAVPGTPYRAPGVLVFATHFPLSPPSLQPSAVPPRAEPAAAPAVASAAPAASVRAVPPVAAVVRRPCPGPRCPEKPLVQAARAPDEPARAATAAPKGDGLLPPLALPFAGTVAETILPAARAVGRGVDGLRRGVSGAAGGAEALLRGGAQSVRGSVSFIAECLP